MKKFLTYVSIAALAVSVLSCGGNRKAKQTDSGTSKEKSFVEQQQEEYIKMQIDSLAAEMLRLKPLDFVAKTSDGSIVLTDKEKQVKPEYLINASVINDLQTLSQKYRAAALIYVDKEVANLYEMTSTVSDYDKALTKLYLDINDPKLKEIFSNDDTAEAMNAFYEACKANGRTHFFWDVCAAAIVEHIYIAAQNSEKFLASFDDDSASELTLQIALLCIAIDDLAEINPEYKEIDEALEPISVINAISVDEFREQLAQVKSEVSVSRKSLLK
ncbi:MAG: hypothetical protein MJY77_05620 [Bacteroidaceae bacterium]|nr:hypothetical protein [Bacteroidaceae bacterium]